MSVSGRWPSAFLSHVNVVINAPMLILTLGVFGESPILTDVHPPRGSTVALQKGTV